MVELDNEVRSYKRYHYSIIRKAMAVVDECAEELAIIKQYDVIDPCYDSVQQRINIRNANIDKVKRLLEGNGSNESLLQDPVALDVMVTTEVDCMTEK